MNQEQTEPDFQPDRELLDLLDRLWGDDPRLNQGDFSLLGPQKFSGIEVGDYHVQEILGSGGFGIVYLAQDQRQRRPVALKVPRPEVLLNLNKRARFQAEADLASRLQHPGIVALYEASLDSPTPFIASEYCPGENLASWIARQTTPPDWRDVVNLMIKICYALEHAHQRNVAHRDLKPANILLVPKSEDQRPAAYSDQNSAPIARHVPKTTETVNSKVARLSQCTPKVTDFGLGKLADDKIADTRSSQVLGSPLYMPPESLDLNLNDQRFAGQDIYSLGVILFELISLKLPYDGETYFDIVRQIRKSPIPNLQSPRPDTPEALDRICNRCLQKHPNMRYTSVERLRNDLENVLAERPISRNRGALRRRIGNYMVAQDRISDAAKVMIWIQVAMLMWMNGVWPIYAMIMPAGASTPSGQTIPADSQTQVFNATESGGVGIEDSIFTSETLISILLVNFIVAVPSLWLAFQVMQSKRWAIIASLAMVGLTLPAIIAGCINQPVFFTSVYYGRPLFSLSLHFLLLTLHVVLAFLLLCALLAVNRIASNQPRVASSVPVGSSRQKTNP